MGVFNEERIRFLTVSKESVREPTQATGHLRLDTASVEYFKELAGELGMPYQNLINLFLRDCAVNKRRPAIDWRRDESKRQGVR